MSIKYGTRAGWNLHMRRKEKACTECNEANRIYTRDYRQRKTSKRAFTFPLEARFDRLEVGLGAVIARSFRESA